MRWLFADCEGLVEVRELPSRRCTFWRLDQLRDLGRYVDIARTSQNVYVTIATRANADNGTLANCVHLPALFADIDFKTAPEDDARARLAQTPMPPDAIVQSGGGLHCYWKLPVPLDLQTEAPRAKRLLRQMAVAVGGDLAAAEPARILRIPRTVNHKYTPKRPVVLELLRD